MSDEILDTIALETYKIETIFKEADMARAYIDITNQMGPSEQLIAFVNYNNNIKTDDGVALESMNMFDQHNYLMEKLNPDVVESMATEGLVEALKKYKNTFLATGGVLGLVLGWGPITLGLITAGVAGYVFRAGENKVDPLKKFTTLTQMFDGHFKNANLFLASVPKDLDVEKWKKFSDFLNKEFFDSDEKLVLTYEKLVDASYRPMKLEDSGWTLQNLQNALKWIKDKEETIKNLAKKQKDLFDKLLSQIESSKDSKASKYISEALRASSSNMKNITNTLKEADRVAQKVVKLVEKK